MRVSELREQLAHLPDAMRVVTPDFLATRLVVEHVTDDIFVAVITDYDEAGAAQNERIYD